MFVSVSLGGSKKKKNHTKEATKEVPEWKENGTISFSEINAAQHWFPSNRAEIKSEFKPQKKALFKVKYF